MQVASDGTHLWVTHGVPGSGPGGITELDIASGQLVRNVRTGPSVVRDHGRRRHVWVGQRRFRSLPGHTVTEIDERTGRVVRTIGIGLLPIAIASDGRRVYVATAQGLVTAINAANGRRLYTTEVAPDLSGIASDGTARVGDRRGVRPRRRARSRATAGSSRPIRVGDGPTGIASDGAHVWVANTGRAPAPATR